MPATPPIVRFGVFELDLDSQELSKQGRKLKLQEQPFRLLNLLIEHPGELVARERLREALWRSDTFVDFDHSLNAAVAKLRQALGDSAVNPRFVQTVAKRGYRFIAPVEFAGSGDANGNTAVQSFEVNPALDARRTKAGSGEDAVVRAGYGRWRVWASVTAAAIAVAVFAVWSFERAQTPRSALVKLTNGPGLTTDPAVSPDGKFLAYASDRGGGGNLNIWIQQLGSPETAVQLTHGNFDAREPAFSPDSGTIAYRSRAGRGGIFLVPVIGGEPVRLTTFGRNPRFSPDGQSIAFWHSGSDAGIVAGPMPSGIHVVPVSGGEPKRLGSDLYAAMNPVWSADGKHLLVYVPPRHGYLWNEADWWTVALDGTPSARTGDFAALKRQGFAIGFDRLPSVSQWTEDSITFAGVFGDAMNVWQAPVSREGRINGRAERLTSGTNLEIQPTRHTNGNLVFASLNRAASVWSLPMDPDVGAVTGELKRISAGDAEFLPSASADGAMVAFTAVNSMRNFPAHASGTLMQEAAHLETRVKNLSTGSEAVMHGPSGPQWHPQISRDASMVAWTMGKPGRIYSAPATGGTPRLIVDGRNAFVWDWSRDKRRIVFNRFDQDVQRLYIADVDAGQPRLFADRPGFRLFQAKFSPDDKAATFIGCHEDQCQIFIAPIENGAAVQWQKWIGIDHVSNWDDKPRWSPSGDLLYFISDRDGYFCLWAQRVHRYTKKPAGSPFPAYHLHAARLSMSNLDTGALEIAIAKDRVLFGLGELTGNIWSLIRDQH